MILRARASLTPIRYGRWPHTTIDSSGICPGRSQFRLPDVFQPTTTPHHSFCWLRITPSASSQLLYLEDWLTICRGTFSDILVAFLPSPSPVHSYQLFHSDSSFSSGPVFPLMALRSTSSKLCRLALHSQPPIQSPSWPSSIRTRSSRSFTLSSLANRSSTMPLPLFCSRRRRSTRMVLRNLVLRACLKLSAFSLASSLEVCSLVSWLALLHR